MYLEYLNWTLLTLKTSSIEQSGFQKAAAVGAISSLGTVGRGRAGHRGRGQGWSLQALPDCPLRPLSLQMSSE